MSCLSSGLFTYGAIGRTDVIFNSSVFVTSVTNIIFGVVFLTVQGPSHLCDASRITRNWSPCL